MKFKVFIIVFLMILAFVSFSLNKTVISVETKSCVGCADCQKVCPVKAIEVIDGKAVIDQEKCIKCEICLKSCTYDAIRKY